MYVTLEPCPMCAGAIIQARVKRVVTACMNPKAGSVGSILNLFEIDGYNHQPEFVNGIMEEECSDMLKNFFKELRLSKKRCESEKE